MSENEHDQCAIFIKNAKKSYGEKKVLNNLCMNVPRGCIYGLLGASGCGKTTLLDCLVGLKHLDYGDIYVFGGKSGTAGCGVLGSAVGYMPQDIALVEELTVQDTVYYFGRIHMMDDWLIEKHFKTLKLLLDLPPDNRQLKNCSGGEQRRVSFAAAMVHKPQLLILDEPTVGLDPVLRDNIWNHLIEIAEKEHTTIIITTHYIEEARQAHKIGLMREGELLIQESPERLLQVFHTETLEEVFVILSKQQEEGKHNHMPQENVNSSIMTLSAEPNGSSNVITSIPMQIKQVSNNNKAACFNKYHIKALMSKNAKQFRRNVGFVVYAFILPILQLSTFMITVGRDPHDLKFAVVNDDAHFKQCANYTKNGTAMPYNISNCHFSNLACRFLKEIENPMLDMQYYDNLHDAFEDMRHGDVVGALQMAQNYSHAFSNRINAGRVASSEDLEFSEIKVWLDMSNSQIVKSVRLRLFRLFENFQVSAFNDCNYFSKFGRIPFRFTFEYGTEGEEHTHFMLPGILLTTIFFVGMILTSMIIITERQEGAWGRSIVAGVSALDIVVTHFATQFVLALIQTCEIIIFTFVIYARDYEGNLYLIFLFILLQGLAGMMFGFCISVILKDHATARLACSGSFLPMIVLCGILWPVESQPSGLRYISQCLAFTLPIISLRKVIKKGYGLDEWQVWSGLSVSTIWILIPLLISMYALKATR